jgi:hypothetical protein
MSVLAALRKDPKKQLLIYGPFYPSNNDADAILSYTTKMMSSANPENYLQFNQRKFLEIVEQFYDRMLKVAVNNTIHTLSQLSNSD